MERTSVFDTIKFRPGFCFFCFEQITVFQYFRDNSTIKELEIPLFFLWMEIYWFSILGEGRVLKWSSILVRHWNVFVRGDPGPSN